MYKFLLSSLTEYIYIHVTYNIDIKVWNKIHSIGTYTKKTDIKLDAQI